MTGNRVRAYIGLGANLGEGRENLLAAWRQLAAEPGITTLRLSRPWRSEPLVSDHRAPHLATSGPAHVLRYASPSRSPQPAAPCDRLQWFTNAVGELETDLGAEQLLAVLLRIETEMGRDRRRQGFDRPIDLDLLLYGEAIINLPHLVVPHPEMLGRRFVLEPLSELAPDLVPPGGRQTVAAVAAALAAAGEQRLTPGQWD